MATALSKDSLTALIKGEYYTRVPNSTMTLCVLELTSGFRVVGESACLNPDNFDEAYGRKLAYEDAFRKLWAFEGYARMQSVDDGAKKRVENERDQLSERLVALKKLRQGVQPAHVSDAQWSLLSVQASCMQDYLKTLETRLKLWG